MSEIQGLREQILANYDHLDFPTPVTRANIILEAAREGGYNAIITDKASRKKVLECRNSGSTITEALEGLLRITATLIRQSTEDPDRWRRVASLPEPFVVPLLPSGDGDSDDEDSNDEVINEAPVPPVRGRKRPASAMNPGSEIEPSLAGFPRLPSILNEEPRTNSAGMALLTPVGDSELAAIACASLPPRVSKNAKRLFYELITYPNCPVSRGVSLHDLAKDTGLKHESLELWAKELQAVDNAFPVSRTRATWMPKIVFGSAHT
ncbi:hypothetical protein KCV01_g3284, partial [Aureobasidium melanogenum]